MKILNSSKNEVLGRLKVHGLTAKGFAEQHGFKADTVLKNIERHVGTGSEGPKGEVAQDILNRLEEFLWPSEN